MKTGRAHHIDQQSGTVKNRAREHTTDPTQTHATGEKKKKKRKPFTPNTAVGSTGNPIKEVCTREAHKAAEGPGWATLNPPRRTHGDSGAPQPGTGCEKKKISALGRHTGSRGPRKTRELHSLVPAPQKKKKSTSTVKGSIERQLPPSKRSGRQTTKRGRLTRFTTGKKKKKKQGSRSSQKAHTGPSPKRQREIRGRGLG